MIFITPPLQITDHPADANHKGGTRAGYRFIFIHATAGTDSLDWLSTTSPQGKRVSCHRLIDKKGTNYKIVPDHEVAWTQGPAVIGPTPANGQDANELGLSIEFENLNDGRDPYPAAQLDMGAAQVVEWWGLYGFIPILAHTWAQADKSDPLGFPWEDFYRRIWVRLRAIAGVS